MKCPRCAEPLPEPGTLNFCTTCGFDLRAKAGAGGAAAQPMAPPVVRLVTCPHCGASNAASRALCALCHGALDPDAQPPPASEPVAPSPPPLPVEPESARLLMIVTAVAGSVILAVVLTLLAARGFGLLPPPGSTEIASAADEFVRVGVASVTASSVLPAAGDVTYEATNLIDGRAETAWNEGARGAVGESVELRLVQEQPVARVLVWNGYQKGDQFERNGRVRTLLIEAGQRRFTVDLLNVQGSQAVDLPEPVPTRTVRLTIQGIYEGARYPDTALSEVQIYRRAQGA